MSIIALNQSISSLGIGAPSAEAPVLPNDSKDVKRVGRSSTKDGGYSWVILFAVFILNVCLDGCLYSFGFVLPEIKQYYGISQSTSNLIVSINTGLLYCSGMFSNALVEQFGCRAVVMVSAAVAALMNLSVAFLSESYLIVLTYGAVGGIATGCAFLVGFIVVVQYFDKKLGLATGLSTSGSGVGAFLFPLLTRYLLSNYDWKFTMIIYACIILNCVVLGALMRPVKVAFEQEMRPLRKDSSKEAERKAISQVVISLLKDTFNFRLLIQNLSFAMISLSLFFYALTFFIPFIFLPIRGKELLDLNITWVISVIGLVNIIGRIFFGLLVDKTSLTAVDMNTFCTLVMTISYLAYYFLDQFWMQLAYAACYALAMSGMCSLCTPFVCQIVGSTRFGNANGILNIFKGTACVIGPILAGVIYDKTNSILYPFMFGALCCGISFVFSLVASIRQFMLRRSSSKRYQPKNIDQESRVEK